MAEIKEVFQITTLPGVKRDGTNLDGDNFVDAQWCRFIRKEGRPKKMGGYQEINTPLAGPIRALQVWTRGDLNEVIAASKYGITQANIDKNGGAGPSYDRTPAGMPTFDGVWTLETMYDDAVGSQNTILIAHRASSLSNIDDPNTSQVYYGVISDTTALVPISGLSVSGGVCAVGPYLVYYGSDGLVGWSDVNQPQTLTGGDAGSDRVTGAKVVKALPLRSGSGPAALLWSLDTLLRMDYVGGAAIFKFSVVSAQTSILSQNSVIEYDGDYMWIGVDRFMAYTGGKVIELPNELNKNWFFDNVNFEHRQKIWATKVPRFGEIIWFFPFGDSTECNRAIVFNINLKTWYDFELSRTAGYYSQVFHYPVWSGDSSNALTRVALTGVTGSFQSGDICTGNNTNTVCEVHTVESATSLLVKTPLSPGRTALLGVGETLVNNSRSGTGVISATTEVHSSYIHEKGKNAVTVGNELAIPAHFETSDFGYPTGGSQQNNIKGINRWTRLIRIEPDFIQNGDMTVEVAGREFAQQDDTYSEPFTFGYRTGKIDLREQRRQIRLRFSSNTINGDFEMGRVILHTEPGDVRS
jgi:hypothetical protein